MVSLPSKIRESDGFVNISINVECINFSSFISRMDLLDLPLLCRKLLGSNLMAGLLENLIKS